MKKTFALLLLTPGLLLAGCSSDQPEPTQTPAVEVPTPSPIITTDPAGPGPAPDPNNLPADTVSMTKKQVVAKTTGKPLNEATDIAHKGGYTVRLIQVDGQDMPATMDFMENRVNFKVKNGQVTEASIG